MKIIEIDTCVSKKVLSNNIYNDRLLIDFSAVHLEHKKNCYFYCEPEKIKLELFNNLILQGVDARCIKNMVNKLRNDTVYKSFFVLIKEIKIISKKELIFHCLGEKAYYLLKDMLQSPLISFMNGVVTTDNELQSKIYGNTIRLKFLNNSDERFECLKRNKIDYTWPLNGNVNELNKFSEIKEKYDFINECGRNFIYFYSSNSFLVSFVSKAREKIFEQLTDYVNDNQLDATYSFIYDENRPKQDLYECTDINNWSKKYTIAFSDYYPNKEIALLISNVLKDYNINCRIVNCGSLDSYLNKRKQYDGFIGIIAPIFFSEWSIPYQLIAGAYDKSSAFDALINYNKDKAKAEFSNVKNMVPLFRTRNIYFKKKSANELYFDNYGRIRILSNGDL